MEGVWKGPLAEVPQAPVCPKKEHQLEEMFGDKRQDPYYWLRDDERKNEEMLKVMENENAYFKQCFADTVEYQEKLFQEIKARIQEDDSSVPHRKSGFFYYEKDEAGKQYKTYCRRTIPKDAAPSIHDGLKMEGVGEEQVLLDCNMIGVGREYINVLPSYSHDQTRMAYLVDVTGAEEYQLFVADLTAPRGSEEDELKLGPGIPKAPKEVDIDYYRKEHNYLMLDNGTLRKCSTNLAWAADGNHIFYVLRDHANRPFQVWQHTVGAPADSDKMIFEDKDERFYVSVSGSRDKRFLYINSSSSVTAEEYLLDATLKDTELKLIKKREHGVDYGAYIWRDFVMLLTNIDNAVNFKLMACPLKRVLEGNECGQLSELIAHNDKARVQNVTAFKDFIVVSSTEQAQEKIRVYSQMEVKGEELNLGEGVEVEFEDEVYGISYPRGEYDSPIMRFTYQSLAVPRTTYDYDMASRERATKKVQPVLGSFDKGNYKTERRWVEGHDGVKIPVSMVYRKDKVVLNDEGRVVGFLSDDGKKSKPGPVVLEGYGSYEIQNTPYFSLARLSLLNRGVVYVVAHIRGGGEMGRMWYEDGKFLKKMNTFHDFISVSEAICGEWGLAVGGKDVNEAVTPRSLVIEGGSAGGMLMGGVMNMRPDLYAGVEANVPFVDCLTTMLDESIPLTVGEFEEWGNPKEEKYYWYMKSYAPYDNVKDQTYPPVYVTAGLNDPRVGYWEPAKWVAKLREVGKGRSASEKPAVFLHVDMGAGHQSFSGRFDRLRTVARSYAFITKCLRLPEEVAE